MKNLLASLLAVSLLSFIPAHAADKGGGEAALNALPAKYRDGVLKLSADNGTPNPPTWYIVAKNSNEGGALYTITIEGGQVVRERLSLNLRALIANSPINLRKVRVGSDDAWNAAVKYCDRRGRKLGSVSYALEQHGGDASPVWSVWCYDLGGSYIGLIKILATNGSIISNE